MSALRLSLHADLPALPDDDRHLSAMHDESSTLVEDAPTRYHTEQMKILPRLALGVLTRRLVKIFTSIDQRLAEQNTYLRRLADHYAPQIAEKEPQAAEAGVDFLNPVEAAVAQRYIDKTYTATGRYPTDDEIARYLDDESTLELIVDEATRH